MLDYGKIDNSVCAVFYVRNMEDLVSSFIPKARKYSKEGLFQIYAQAPAFSQIDAEEAFDNE